MRTSPHEADTLRARQQALRQCEWCGVDGPVARYGEHCAKEHANQPKPRPLLVAIPGYFVEPLEAYREKTGRTPTDVVIVALRESSMWLRRHYTEHWRGR